MALNFVVVHAKHSATMSVLTEKQNGVSIDDSDTCGLESVKSYTHVIVISSCIKGLEARNKC